MAVGLDLDTEYLERTGIPSGGAGSLSGGGFSDFLAGVWLYRPSVTATHPLTASGSIIHCEASARQVILGFDSAGSNLSDLSLRAIFNSGGGTGTPYFFPSHNGASFLDEWVYYFVYENSANSLVAGYIRLANLSVAVSQSYVNDNAGSQYVNSLSFGNEPAHNNVVLGRYAYARAVASAALTAADVLAYAASTAPLGAWAFWELPNASTGTDSSGNGRTLTLGGTLTNETSPTLPSPPVITVQPVSTVVKIGATATFSVTDTGGTSYQWQRQQGGSFSNVSGGSGGTTATYTTGVLTASDSGGYKCQVTNTDGTTTTIVVSLTVARVRRPGEAQPFRFSKVLPLEPIQLKTKYTLTQNEIFGPATLRTIIAQLVGFSLGANAVGLKKSSRVTAALSSFGFSANAIGLRKQYTSTNNFSAFVLAAQIVQLRASRNVQANAGSFVLSPQNALLRKALVSANAVAAYSFGANAVALRKTSVIAGLVSAFSLQGQTAQLRASRSVGASLASFALSGIAANLSRSVVMPAAVSSFSLQGQAAALRAAHRLQAAASAFTLSGNAAALLRGLSVGMAPGSFVLAGQTAALKRSVRLIGEAANFTLTGRDATLSKQTGQSYLPASFSVLAQDAAFLNLQKVAANLGAFVASGQTVLLHKISKIDLASISFALSPNEIRLATRKLLSAEQSSFSLIANDVALLVNRKFDSAVFVLFGNEANLRYLSSFERSEERTFIVPLESRLYSVDSENRGYSVDSENRVHKPNSENRKHLVS